MKTFTALVNNTINHSALMTLDGMLSGYFTSPLIADYGFTAIVDVLKESIKDEAWAENAKVKVKEQMRAVYATKQKIGLEVVGQYKIAGMGTVDRVVQRHFTVQDVEKYKRGEL